jgi:ATP/maltotriose-dependent transcriptional regulator MalT
LKSAQQAVALAEKWKQADTLHYSLSVLIDTYLALGYFMEAGNIIQRSKWIARNVSDWFMAISEFQEAKLNLACENWDPFLQWKQRRCTPGAMGISYYPVLARYFMNHKDYSEALKVLDDGISTLQEAGFWGRTIELYLMRAVVFSTTGKMEKAMKSLSVALKMGEPEGYLFLFVMHGKPMEKLLRQAVKKEIQKEFAQKLLDIMAVESSQPKGVDSTTRSSKPGNGEAILEPLSERELDVLRLLNSHLSVPEIAQELTVAPSTVRTHVRVVYNKLGVHGRLEAIQKAKELALI